MQTSKLIPTLILTFIITVFSSCQKENKAKVEQEIAITQNQFIKENVSFVDARIRSIDVHQYVREIFLMNHSDLKMMPSSLIFKDTYFVDDGSSNDLKSNDGIYTSINKFDYSETIKYDKYNSTVSIMREVIVDKNFKYKDQIKNLSAFKIKSNINKGKSTSGAGNEISIIEVKCDIEFGTTGCRAARWGWCNSCCFYIGNCSEITFGF